MCVKTACLCRMSDYMLKAIVQLRQRLSSREVESETCFWLVRVRPRFWWSSSFGELCCEQVLTLCERRIVLAPRLKQFRCFETDDDCYTSTDHYRFNKYRHCQVLLWNCSFVCDQCCSIRTFLRKLQTVSTYEEDTPFAPKLSIKGMGASGT